MFKTIKTEMIALFDEKYVVFANTAAATTIVPVTAAASPGENEMPYPQLNNTKILKFDGVKDPIFSMRRISDVEGCFYICSFLANLKFRYVQNLLRLRVKYWWNFATKNYSPTERSTLN